MNDATDITTLSIRMGIFVVIAVVFFFILRGDKKKKD